jgi:hypothetical protein
MLLIGVEAVSRLVHYQNRRVVRFACRRRPALLRQGLDHLIDDVEAARSTVGDARSNFSTAIASISAMKARNDLGIISP